MTLLHIALALVASLIVAGVACILCVCHRVARRLERDEEACLSDPDMRLEDDPP